MYNAIRAILYQKIKTHTLCGKTLTSKVVSKLILNFSFDS